MTELGRFFAARPLIARCRACGQLIAVYLEPGGWQADNRCTCDPPRDPVLPDGPELGSLVAHGRPIRV